MWNTIILALLTHTFNKENMIYQFILTKGFSIIWHNDSVMGSNQQYIRHYGEIKQSGETVIAG